MTVNKYDYEITIPNGSKYGYVLKENNVEVYVNNEKWGSPQGERFIIALLHELIKKEKYCEELLNNWSDKVIDRADNATKLSEEFEFGSASYYRYKSYADGLYMATSILSLEEREMKRKLK